MRKENIVLAVVCLAFIWSAAGAQDINDPISQSAIRSIHDRSPTLPDGIAFKMAAYDLSELAKEDPEFAFAWMHAEMGLDETGSEQLIAVFRTALKEMNAETEGTYREIACITGVPRVYGDDAFVALEQMDDAAEAVAESHYLRVKTQIDGDTAERVQAWVEKQKLNIVHMKFNQKKQSSQTGVGGYERLEKICNTLNAQPAEGNRP